MKPVLKPTGLQMAHSKLSLILLAAWLCLGLLAACGDASPTSVGPALATPAPNPTTAIPATTALPATTAPLATKTPPPTTTAAPKTTTAAPNTTAPATTTAVTANPAGAVNAKLDTAVSLKYNQSALVASENLQVKFAGVLGDTRCSVTVKCVQTNQVVIEIEVSKNGQSLGKSRLYGYRDFQKFFLETDKKFLEDYYFGLVKVTPNRDYTSAGEPKAIAISDYTVDLIISKAGVVNTPIGNEPVKAEVGTVFDLKVDQTALLASENLQIKFANVTEDSRCPIGASIACAWSGQVVIEVGVSKSGQSVGSFKLTTLGPTRQDAPKTFENYSLILLKILPERVGNPPSTPSTPPGVKEIKTGDYIAKLVLVKL